MRNHVQVSLDDGDLTFTFQHLSHRDLSLLIEGEQGEKHWQPIFYRPKMEIVKMESLETDQKIFLSSKMIF